MLLSSVVLLLAGLALASDGVDCSKNSSWSIKDFHIKSRDEVGRNGSAAFTITDNLSGTSDPVNCTLIANYRSELELG